MFYEVIVDVGETPNKCTILPLRHRKDFHLTSVKGRRSFDPFRSEVLLHHEGQCLTELRKSLKMVQGIACIDCVWRRLDGLLKRVAPPLPLLARIPDGFVTAYPRKSAQSTDPDGGLATIEAIFVAAALLGHWDPSLLSEYHFGRKFVEMNQKLFVELGVIQAADSQNFPVLNQQTRNSRQRRLNRKERL